ncbi:MAG: ABC transporter permease subunit, partial [Armatimonadetes bacterium]|nr:ABC transporter permease subunit [Armatimonadota bacterium]
FIMWCGLGLAPKIILAALFVFFVVFMNVLEGIRQVGADLLHVARVLGASRAQIIRKIVLPSVAPFVLVALRIAVPEAMVGAVIGEFIAANSGLGYFISQASNQFNTTSLLAGVVVLLVIVLLLEGVVSLLERRALRWRPAARESARE